MRIRICLLLIVCSFSVTALAQEELEPAQGWYFRVDAGYSSARDPELTIPEGPLPAELGNSAVLGAGIGSTYVPGIRTDLTFTYRGGFRQVSGFSGMPTGEAEFHSLVMLLSAYLDIVTLSRVSPYGGFGLGFAQNKLGDITINDTDGSLLGTIGGEGRTSFAWQLCLGTSIQVTNRILLDVGYHYLKAGDYESEELLVFPDGTRVPAKDQGTLRANEVIVSIQYHF